MSYGDKPVYSSAAAYLYKIGMVGCLVAALLILDRLRQSWHYFTLDDAYTFYRYAINIRHGAGISWNPRGPHTYGATSLLWVAVVLVFSFLPVSPSHAVLLASWVAGIFALGIMGLIICRAATSHLFQDKWIALAAVAVPLCVNTYFLLNLSNGMETMLAMLLSALFVQTAWTFLQRPTAWQALRMAILAFACFLARPESGLCTASTVLLAALYLWRRDILPAVAAYFSCFAGLVLVELIACAYYFGSALPLGFYAKSGHRYAGYMEYWCWPCYLVMFLGICEIYVILCTLCLHPVQTKRLAIFVVPPVLVIVYLATINQIMGTGARYYAPYLPFVIIPAILLFDQTISSSEGLNLRLTLRRTMAVLAVAVCTSGSLMMPRALQLSADLGYTVGYRRPEIKTAESCTLPTLGWGVALEAFSSNIARKLPAGSTIYASEVGQPGVEALQSSVIDLAGLHDTTIARHGVSMDSVIANRPDLIWLPHYGYTHLYGAILSDPRLLQQYQIIAGAFDYGVAVRRESPEYAEIMRSVANVWPTLYPGTSVSGCTVTAITWDASPVLMRQQLFQ